MTESEFGQWFFGLMIALALGWVIISTVWERQIRRRYRDNEEIARRMLGEKRRKR